MIFYLDEDFIIKSSSDANFPIFFSNIMLAYVEGKHIIILNIKAGRGLLMHPGLDSRSIIYLRHYLSHNKSAIGILNYFRVVVQLVSETSDERKFFDYKQKLEFRLIRYTRFLDSASIQKTILLGENGHDSLVYSLFADYHLHSQSIDTLKITFSRRSGGGDTTHSEYKEIYDSDKECCLCILDSDKKTNKKGYGQTALKVAKFHNTQTPRNLKFDYVILPVLEVENLFPEKFYKNTYCSVGKYPSETFPALRRMEVHEKFVRKYFDFKKGIKGYYAQGDYNVVMFWRELICKADIRCTVIDENTYYYVKGFGENVLTDFLNCDPETIFELIDSDPELKKAWTRLGEYIASFIIGREPLRAI